MPSSRTLRRFFIAVMVFLPLQYGAALLSEYVYGVETWPAVVFPSFARIYDVDGYVEVPRAQLYVTFADSEHVAVPTAGLLADVPVSLRRTVMRRIFGQRFRPPTFPDETRRWLRGRMKTLYPDGRPVNASVYWRRYRYVHRGGRLVLADSAAFDVFRTAL